MLYIGDASGTEDRDSLFKIIGDRRGKIIIKEHLGSEKQHRFGKDPDRTSRNEKYDQ